MAMDKTRLANAIADAVEIANPEATGAKKAQLAAAWELIANEIILEIRNNIEITTQVTGVTAGAQTATGNSTVVL